MAAGAEMGPVVSSAPKQRIEKLIGEGVEAGAELLVDGRNFHRCRARSMASLSAVRCSTMVTPDMSIYTEEIFGPVLCMVRLPDVGACAGADQRQ